MQTAKSYTLFKLQLQQKTAFHSGFRKHRGTEAAILKTASD